MAAFFDSIPATRRSVCPAADAHGTALGATVAAIRS